MNILTGQTIQYQGKRAVITAVYNILFCPIESQEIML